MKVVQVHLEKGPQAKSASKNNKSANLLKQKPPVIKVLSKQTVCISINIRRWQRNLRTLPKYKIHIGTREKNMGERGRLHKREEGVIVNYMTIK